jgi:Phosphotransferase enzyme family
MDGVEISHILATSEKEKLGRGTSRVQSGRQSVILKQQPPSQALVSRISRMLFKSSLPFRNELQIANYFLHCPPTQLRIAKPLASDGKSYIIFENLVGSRPISNQRWLDSLTPGLVEFALAPLPGLPTAMQRTAFRILEAPSCRIAQRSISRQVRRELGFLGVARCWVFLFKANLKTPRQSRKINIHNDLAPHNLLISEGEPFVLDFEDAVPEARWLLVDIVDAAWDRTTLDLDKRAVRHFAESLRSAGLRFDLQSQLQFALVRRALMWIANAEVPANRRHDLKTFLRHTLLDRRKFGVWFNASRLHVT